MVVEVQGIEILARSAVSPDEFDRIYKQLDRTQLPIKARRGMATYKVGTILRVTAGRDAMLANIALSTNFTLELSGEGDEITAEHLEWKI